MGITRRIFMKSGAMTVVGMAAVPEFLARAAMAAEAAQAHKRLVVIFQRGAADGLNIVVPHGEAAYYAMRPTIAIPKRDVIDLDGFFGLHPGDERAEAAVGCEASGDRSCRRIARPDALALRRAGLYGERHAGGEEPPRTAG